MKAVIQTGYGSADAMKHKELDKPVPGSGQVLVRVRAASLAAGDYFAKAQSRYDVILDNVGSHSLSATRRVLTPTAIHLPSSGHAGMGWVFAASLASVFVRRQAAPFVAKVTRESLLALKELIEAGKVTPVIDRTFPLDETPAAFAYLDQGHARGKVVIAV